MMRHHIPLAMVVAACLVATAHADIMYWPFDWMYWGAEGVAVGKIVAVHPNTIDVKVEKWVRDRTGVHAGRVRTTRYVWQYCISSTEASYSVGSRYLFLLSKPHDDVPEGNPDWVLFWQAKLGEANVCIDFLGQSPLETVLPNCRASLAPRLFLDAVKSFEECFELQVAPDESWRPVAQVCSDRTLRKWANRSPFHARLAQNAIDAIQHPDEPLKFPTGGI